MSLLGITDNFVVRFIPTNANALAMAQAVLDKCEGEFTELTGWFGITSGFGPGNRIKVSVEHLDDAGAQNQGYDSGGDTYIKINFFDSSAADAPFVAQMRFVAELVEIFMEYRDPSGDVWNRGWSDGEGLSHFCSILRFQDGYYKGHGSFGATWMTSLVPNGREDWVNHIEKTDGNPKSHGCALMFLFYLKDQLGFSPEEIIQNGGRRLAETYSNLTGDTGEPFGFFTRLVGLMFPDAAAVNAAASEAAKDNPFPIFNVEFASNKGSFSKSEVQNSFGKGDFTDSIRLVLEGCSPFMLAPFGITTPTQPAWAAPSGFSSTTFPLEAGIIFQYQTLPRAPQQIEFSFNAHFDPSVLAAFASFPQNEDLTSTLPVTLPVTTARSVASAQTLAAKMPITFYGAQDPYFVTFAPGKANEVWASEDLRVFSAISGHQTVRGGPSFLNNSIPGAFQYITDVLKFLSSNYGDPSGVDPFEPSSNVLPDQTYALQGDSSVVPSTSFINAPGGATVYNFAVARVRLNGAIGTSTNGPVKVFFRMWSTATPDTVYNDTRNYNSHKDALSLPDWPLPAPDTNTFPFFATSNTPAFSLADNPEYGAGGANSQPITIQHPDGQWAYFGCFLNVYDANNIIQGDSVIHLLQGAHHCLVAQIAHDDAPIQTPPSVPIVPAPGQCDKLVQRNLQITLAYNPGLAPTNRLPHTFDVAPTDPAVVGALYPFDELKIEWGQVPLASIASIYWPAVAAADIVALADSRYGYHSLKAVDAHTVEMEVIRGFTLVPIPAATGPNLAGLLTVELVPVSRGNEYAIAVHRVARGYNRVERPPPRLTRGVPHPTSASSGASDEGATRALPVAAISDTPASGALTAPKQSGESVYRIVTGAFQINISVRADDEVLPYDEETLSIFKYRLSVMKQTNRWYPVLKRYIEYLSLRVDGHGGRAAAVPPSATGLARPPCRRSEHGHEGVHYNCEKCRF